MNYCRQCLVHKAPGAMWNIAAARDPPLSMDYCCGPYCHSFFIIIIPFAFELITYVLFGIICHQELNEGTEKVTPSKINPVFD